MDQLPEEGEASSDLSNPHVLYRKVIEYVGAADQLANLSQEVPYLHNQGCGSGSGLDPDSIGSVDPDPDPGGQK